MATHRNPARATTPARPPLYDHELDDLPRQSPSTVQRRIADVFPERYLRLVANPFLAFLGMVIWFGLTSWVLRGKRIDLFFPVLGSFLLIPLLLQFHCLDCGGTGHVSRWRDHDCLAVRLRRERNRPRWLRGPSPVTQTVFWMAIGFLGLLILAIQG
ncbi:MAG: hypothetical protein AB7I30_21490 [Isosphaeraceae bacterium]